MAKSDLQKHTMHLRAGDWDYIESLFKVKGVSTSLVVGTIVANFVDKRRSLEGSPDPIEIKVDL